ncbi:hypothetical protein HJFPF1_05828 [Paramyrothecium foliicola]|nr:hypothetical protein HJFPF1_05828 [Paramyrothecium foliicola]
MTAYLYRDLAFATMAPQHGLNLLTATVAELRALLKPGEYTSVQLVNLCLDIIAEHNHQGLKLHAVVSTAPRASVLAEAEALHDERSDRGLRSRLHDIPILVKVPRGCRVHAFFRHEDDVRVLCSCGPQGHSERSNSDKAMKKLDASSSRKQTSPWLYSFTYSYELLNEGSEWANDKGIDVTSGWSAVGAQTQSPYNSKGGVVPGDKWMGHSATAGSSSGSAAGLAAVGDMDMVGTQAGGAAFGCGSALGQSVENFAGLMDVMLPE